MKILRIVLSVLFSTILFGAAKADDQWPQTITASDGTVIKIYEPQPESFQGDVLKARSAISILENGQSDPTFGTFWEIATVQTDRDNRQVNIESVKVPNLKLPGDVDANKISYLKTTLETEIPRLSINLSLDNLLSSLDQNAEEKKLSKDLNNNPPKIYYANKPSILVTIDGQPKIQHNNNWNVDVVVNSPFTIVKYNDGNYYLYGGKHWYMAQSATGPYSYADNVPPAFGQIETAVNNANTDPGYTDSASSSQSNVISDIVVSTTPAELVQTNGQASWEPVQGTNLLYVSNSQNDIFLDQGSNQYYVLLSGRWYKSANVQGPWQFVAANSLPADFAKIPEGSPKDNVLASVAGTDAAREAVLDAQIPQTAKVDRHNASTNVTYDGNPDFQNIQGTDMQYGVNTPNSVIRSHGRYYSVDNGVWYVSDSPQGPWEVCTQRPDEVDMIPPSNPDYNMKYVDIYDVTPDYVYMGYTPGYLNTYVYGPTVVYGTGFYYDPWFGSYYYPRPYTWGFGMNYNPWFGWSFGFGYGFGWFNVGFGGGIWGGWRGGWWGPAVYHPAYRWGGGRFGYSTAYYGNRIGVNRAIIRNNVRYTNNIYHYNRNAITANNARFANGTNRNNFNRAGNSVNNPNRGGVTRNGFSNNGLNNRANTQNVRSPNNVTTDRSGNVFQRNTQGQWQQRQQRQWQPVNNNQQVQNLNRQQQMRDRGQTRTQNFQATRQSQSVSRPSGGGGSRSSGSGGGRSGGGRRN
jgi:hypothetical protein